LGLLTDDRQFIDAINGVAILSSGRSVRMLFANFLVCSSLADPFRVWQLTWESLADGILYDRRRTLGLPGKFLISCLLFLAIYVFSTVVYFIWISYQIFNLFQNKIADLVISEADLKELCLVEIDKLLRLNGKTLEDFDCMPRISTPVVEAFNNVLLANELSYDPQEMLIKHDEYFPNLNEGQLDAYAQVLAAVYNNSGRMFFVDGYGGTGKTYLWNALSFRLRSEGRIVITWRQAV